jgi:hypothetical protein
VVGFCPAFESRIGVTFAGDGASLFHFAPALDEVAEQAGVPPLTSFAEDREPPPDFDGFREELAEALGPWRDWFSPTEGLKCVEGLIDALEDPAVLKRFEGGGRLVDDLHALHEVLVVAKKKGVRFRLELA